MKKTLGLSTPMEQIGLIAAGGGAVASIVKSQFKAFQIMKISQMTDSTSRQTQMVMYRLDENHLNHSIVTGGNDALDFVVTSFKQINF